jgi:glucose-1-phosphate thymidylyltransferase
MHQEYTQCGAGLVFSMAPYAGTRLHPLTTAVSKQLLPVFDKPMVFYPLSVLLLAGIRDILIISNPEDRPLFRKLLGDGEDFGVRLSYAEQARPNGLAEAFLIGADFVGDDRVALVLGDNIFHGHGLSRLLQSETKNIEGCTLFGYRVSDPGRYGVVETSPDGRILSIEEKPNHPRSNIAVTGLYFYDSRVVSFVSDLKPSARGELEITDLNNEYVRRGCAHLVPLGRGMAWLDTGTPESLLEAGNFVRVLQLRQGVSIGCLEEVAFRMGFITREHLLARGRLLEKSAYGKYLLAIE